MSRKVFIGDTEYFPGIAQIRYEGPESDNPLAFKTYDDEANPERSPRAPQAAQALDRLP